MRYMDNWEKYYRMDRPDPLVQLAILHAQFESIHPFLDGNGRIGRLVIPLFLFEKKVLPSPMFYLSAWLDSHRREYFDRLRAIQQTPEGWSEWIRFFLLGIESQAEKNVQISQGILGLYDRLKQEIIRLTHSQWSIPLLDAMFNQPVFTGSQLRIKKPTPTRAAVTNMFRALHQGRVLKVVTVGSGRRGTVYALAELVNLCEGRKVF